MARTCEAPGHHPRGSTKATSATCSQPTHAADIERAYSDGFCDGWLDRATYARRTSLTFDDGFEMGYWAASREVNNAIAQALGGPHSSRASTDWPTAGEVVRRMLRAVRNESLPACPPVTAGQLRAHDRVAMHRGRLHERDRDPLCSACIEEAA